ncbi:hypothetical protein, partial [Agathobaculum faecis]|uniref:hypothetical protein n=1 Tax=Agathobaculum faecis TaxID=2763013 RepID=UPI001A9A7863
KGREADRRLSLSFVYAGACRGQASYPFDNFFCYHGNALSFSVKDALSFFPKAALENGRLSTSQNTARKKLDIFNVILIVWI